MNSFGSHEDVCSLIPKRQKSGKVSIYLRWHIFQIILYDEARRCNTQETIIKDTAIFVAFFPFSQSLRLYWSDEKFWPENIAVRAKTHNWMLKNACQLIRLVVVPFLLLLQLFSFHDDYEENSMQGGFFLSFYWTHNVCFLACAKIIAEDMKKNYFIIDKFLKLQKSIF